MRLELRAQVGLGFQFSHPLAAWWQRCYLDARAMRLELGARSFIAETVEEILTEHYLNC